MPFVPHTYIFAAKASAGYIRAKQTISLIVAASKLINNDPDVRDKLKVVFIEDYKVSLAEIIIPAADISEQISVAGKEASGTGNMKLMINGAVTLGTLDGANVEIHEQVGDENIFLFGLKANEVDELWQKGYNPNDFMTPELQRVFDMLTSGVLGQHYDDLVASLLTNRFGVADPYMTVADFSDYCREQEVVAKTYTDRRKFAEMSLVNIAKAGIFSSDRSVREYADKIWDLEVTHGSDLIQQPRSAAQNPVRNRPNGGLLCFTPAHAARQRRHGRDPDAGRLRRAAPARAALRAGVRGRRRPLVALRILASARPVFLLVPRGEGRRLVPPVPAGEQTNMESGEKWQLSFVPADHTIPDFACGAVMYQIMPDRFWQSGECDLSEKLRPFSVHASHAEQPCYTADAGGNWCGDFYGGNLRGIQEKLPYLRELGVGILYLNPVFMAYSTTATTLRIISASTRCSARRTTSAPSATRRMKTGCA